MPDRSPFGQALRMRRFAPVRQELSRRGTGVARDWTPSLGVVPGELRRASLKNQPRREDGSPDSLRCSKAALAIAIAAALLVPLPAAAQTLYGSITGTVSDPQGAPIPGATVTATNTGTGLQLTAVTDTRRQLHLPQPACPGIYDLGAALAGLPRAEADRTAGLGRQPGPRGAQARGGRARRDRQRGERVDAAADGEGRPPAPS